MLSYVLNSILLYGLPVVVVVFYVVCLVRFMSAKRKNRLVPDTFSADEMKKRKIMLIVASVLAGALVLFVLGLIALMFMAVAYM